MRISKNVFTVLTMSMIGFGIVIGVLFPFFTLWMGGSKDIAMSGMFFILCVLAGIIVGAVNVALASILVKKRLKRLSKSMIKVEKRLLEIAQNDIEEICASNDCYLVDNSTDDFGKSAHAFNQLLAAFEESLKTQYAVRKYNQMLTSQLQLGALTKGALSSMLSYSGASSGAVYVVKNGELELAACEGIQDAENLVNNNHILGALKSKDTKTIDIPDGIIIDGLLTKIKPRCIFIQPLLYKDTVLGIVVLASLNGNTHNNQHLDMFSSNLALALNNSLKHDQLQTMVALDPLTGVYNRRFGFIRLSEEYSSSIRSGSPLGLLMLDIDYFKAVNDTYGHIAGDKVLVAVAKMVQVTLRKYDILVRYGGEEFVAVLPGASTHDTMVVADRLRALIERSAISYGDNQIYVKVSIGVVSFPDTEISKIEDLIEYADKALYRSKDNGRNQVTLYDESAVTQV